MRIIVLCTHELLLCSVTGKSSCGGQEVWGSNPLQLETVLCSLGDTVYLNIAVLVHVGLIDC